MRKRKSKDPLPVLLTATVLGILLLAVPFGVWGAWDASHRPLARISAGHYSKKSVVGQAAGFSMLGAMLGAIGGFAVGVVIQRSS